jgi:hypothetical protein
VRRIASTLLGAAVLTAGLALTAPPAQAAAYGCSSWKSGNGGEAYCPAGGGGFRVTISCYRYDPWLGSQQDYRNGPWMTAGMGSNSNAQCLEGFEVTWWSTETR